jgi:hypothetical protein
MFKPSTVHSPLKRSVEEISPIFPLSLPSNNTTLSPFTSVRYRPPTSFSLSLRSVGVRYGPRIRCVLTVPNVSFLFPTSRLGANGPNSQSSLLSALLSLISCVTSLRTKVFCSRALFWCSRLFMSFRFARRRAACFSARMVRRMTFCILQRGGVGRLGTGRGVSTGRYFFEAELDILR